ncbi:Hypothetical predicted protein, partial [Scomber scombrus]
SGPTAPDEKLGILARGRCPTGYFLTSEIKSYPQDMMCQSEAAQQQQQQMMRTAQVQRNQRTGLLSPCDELR